jgi:hypothetical protein
MLNNFNKKLVKLNIYNVIKWLDDMIFFFFWKTPTPSDSQEYQVVNQYIQRYSKV